ncbi:MAG: signal peptidase I [Clostridia bacterium]|nr:signal peptidase I [Clostridia bacterium]
MDEIKDTAENLVNNEEEPVSAVAEADYESAAAAFDAKPETRKKKRGKKEKKNDAQEQPFSLTGAVVELVSVFVAALTAIAIIFVFIVRPVGVNGESMVPTLNHKDWLLVTPIYGEPQYGDIIISDPPSFFNEPLVKRVIAVGGQTVDIDFDAGIVYVDGVGLDETLYVNTPTTRRTDQDQTFPLTVPYGYVFMMGDNRNNSTDSRSTLVGFCREEYILGKAIGRVVPFGSWDIYASFRAATGQD